jgi:microcystin-dependent protein
MDSQTLGMIFPWPLDYAPSGWSFCNGQILTITQETTALFSLIGNMYGGNGTSNFALPDLRGKVAIGVGYNQNKTVFYKQGQIGGTESVALTTDNLAAHTHPASPISGTQEVLIDGTITVSGASATTATPSTVNNTIAGGYSDATDSSGGNVNIWNFLPAADNNMITMENALSINVSQPTGAVALASAGGGQPHPNIQPYLALNFIICTTGLYPQRPQ